MKCDIIFLYEDGTWETVENVVYFESHTETVRFQKWDGSWDGRSKIVQMTIQPFRHIPFPLTQPA